MIARCLKRLVVFVLLLLLQGPALLLQEIAWMGMLITYSSEDGLMQGVVETFDGNHPCPMCRKAEAIRQDASQREQPAEKQRERLLSQLLACAHMLPSALLAVADLEGVDALRPPCPGADLFAGRGRDAPEPPPPRV